MKKIHIKSYSSFIEPCYFSLNQDESKKTCQHNEYEEYVVDTLDQCKDALKYLLDAPDAYLTVDDVKRDFSAAGATLAADEAMHIAEYYNARFDKYNGMLSSLDDASKDEDFTVFCDIPKENNFLNVKHDVCKDKQISSYIKVFSAEDSESEE